MREKLLDIIKHTNSLGFDAAVRVIGKENETVFETMDDDRTIIVSAKLKETEETLKGEFGMRNLGLLQGLLTHAPYRADGAKNTIVRDNKDGADTPVKLSFTDANGKSPADFRFMASSLLPQTVQLKQNNWDVTIEPSDSKVGEFSSLAAMYSSIDNYFSVTTNNGDLEFHIGDPNGANHSATMVFATGVKGDLKTPLHWPVSHLLSLLKVGKGESPKISFMAMGALRVELESEHAVYTIILPARRK